MKVLNLRHKKFTLWITTTVFPDSVSLYRFSVPQGKKEKGSGCLQRHVLRGWLPYWRRRQQGVEGASRCYGTNSAQSQDPWRWSPRSVHRDDRRREAIRYSVTYVFSSLQLWQFPIPLMRRAGNICFDEYVYYNIPVGSSHSENWPWNLSQSFTVHLSKVEWMSCDCFRSHPIWHRDWRNQR